MDPRALWKRALWAVLVHAALVLAWPLARPLYAPAYRALENLGVSLVDPLPGPIEVRFEPGTDPLLEIDLIGMDTIVTLRHREMNGAGRFGASSFFHAYFPTSVLVALFLVATPLAWRARLVPFLIAFVLLHLFLLARGYVAILYCHAQSTLEGRPLMPLSPAGLRALQLAWHFAWNEMFTNYLVPLALWGVCVFKPRAGAA
jgi:hypothetical protein